MSDLSLQDLRAAALTIYQTVMAELQIETVMKRKLLFQNNAFSIGESTHDLRAFQRILLIAIGKAAFPMVQTMVAGLDPQLATGQELRGIAVGAGTPAGCDPRMAYLRGAHPFPDASSLAAAQQILALLSTATQDTLVFFLISGGASAMVEQPVLPTITFEELIAFHQSLVHSGLSIAAMNTLRKHLSAVKGGRLAAAAQGSAQCTLLVSDVPHGMPDVIGSGPSLPDTSTLADCRHLLHEHHRSLDLPSAIRRALEDDTLPETPKPSHDVFRRSTHHLLLSSDDLCEAASRVASSLGFKTAVDLTCDEWKFSEAARHLLARSTELREGQQRPTCLISAGELAVPLRGTPGIGGRNQQFALECARQIAGTSWPIVVLSAGSDGLDGNSPAAGAAVDQTTVSRAQAAGFSVQEALDGFNAFPLLRAVDDALITGPSGNNLRDLRLFLQPAVRY